ncbi:cytochrome P450 3A17 [Colletotrichum costaricense]|uniref:Cytochrome P450 3A17 n=1 Tax=Colletotrichum costaricense TaxID=1209916 RepID=A0AAI9YJF1_9PEZI|nr:cytochrome P450 3A17 [Colletotrichum costaricense]KAK1512411.1 cytochrome P450 3A17 [Colletotrichum costaricense]
MGVTLLHPEDEFDRWAMVMALVGATGVLVVCNLLLQYLNSPLKHIPGPWHTRCSRLSLKLSRLTGTRMTYVHQLHERYGSIVRIAPNELSCIDIQSVSQVYKVGGGFEKAQWIGDYATKLPALSLSMILNSEEAKQRRRLLQGSFAITSLRKNWESTIRSKVELAVMKIKTEALAGSSNSHKWWTYMAADVISQLSFGQSLGVLESGKSTMYMRAIENALIADVIQCEIPFLASLSQLIPRSLLQTFSRQLEQVRLGGADGVASVKQRGPSSAQSIFTEMIAECDSEGRTWLTKEAVGMEGAGMMVAGTDTTAAVLTYLIWSVLKQPVLQEKLENEIALLGDNFDDKRLEACPILGAVIEETLRLYPAVLSSLPRLIPGGGTTLSSHFVPAGTVVYSPAYSLQRDPKVFPDPHRFDVDRYLDPTKVSLQQRQAYIPLGAGARVCIGQYLAMMELRLSTAVFFKRCRGARLGPNMPADSMEMKDYVLLSPKRKRCDITLI